MYCKFAYIKNIFEFSIQTDHINYSDKTNRITATRLNIFGLPKKSEFSVAEVIKITEHVHPFVSFNVKGELFYVHADDIQDKQIRQILTNK